MARQRAAATAGLLAAGSIALPFVFATPALAAPGQTFSGTASANFLTVETAPTDALTTILGTLGAVPGVDTAPITGLLAALGLSADIELGNAEAAAGAPGTAGITASGTASNIAAAAEAAGATVALSTLNATQSAPPDNPEAEVNGAAVALGPVLDAALVTNAAGARALDANNCPIVADALGSASTTITDLALLDLPTADGALVGADLVTSTAAVGLAPVTGITGLGTRSEATLDVAGLTLFGGTDAETVIDLDGGSLLALVPSGPGAATTLDYTAPDGSITLAGTDVPVDLPEGDSDTVYLPLLPTTLSTAVPSLSITYTFNTITDADLEAGVATSSILSLEIGVDLDGTGAGEPVLLAGLGIGALGVEAENIEGGITCGTTPVTPPVTTPPGTTTPVVNPIAGGPARPAALANTGAEPLPMLGLGLGLLAVGGAALGAGPLRRRMSSSTPSA